ncbi:MAG: hypothetical protein IGR76_09900, partial [Synechococcales cyanobacterium T60_A2020_003]|nr:hypothetical protein [Synechococcales cyanobacterium T60_A2020_003]
MASSPKNSSENPPPRELEQRLTILEGIGASSAQKLSEIGIVRIADLAQLNPSALGDQLRSANYDVKLATLEKWIEQARQFMASVDTEPPPESSAVASEPLARSRVVEAEAQLTPAANGEKPDLWEEIGNFHITAQAYADGADLRHRWVIRHLETNGVEILPDIVGDRLHDWMTPRLSEINRDRDSTAKTMASPLMQFTGLKVRQPSNPNSPVSVDLPHHTMPPEIDAHTAFILEIDFSITDSGQR